MISASAPDVSQGFALSGLATFLGLKLNYNRGLDVISSLTESLTLWSTDSRLGS